MVEWQNGGRNGRTAERQNGGTAEWRNGGMAEWRNGGMAERRNGYIPNLSDIFTVHASDNDTDTF